MTTLKWNRTEKVIGRSALKTGESIYTSVCGRFVIHQQKWGAKTWYLLDIDGKPARRGAREWDRLIDAKDWANMTADPNYECA